MHKSRLGAVIIDCRTDDLAREAAFWSAALGYAIAPPRPGDTGRYIHLTGPADQVSIELQSVEHESRVHLDIETDDFSAEIARLEKLGATRVKDHGRWVVMQAPSGQRFCVVNPQRADFEENAKAWP